MVTRTLNKRLLRLIRDTRGQFISAVLVIATGIFTFTALTNAAINLDDTLESFYAETHFADAFITTAFMPEGQARRLAQDPEVLSAAGRIVMDVPLLTAEADQQITVRLISAPAAGDELNQLHVQAGSLSIRGSEVLVLDQFAQGRGLAVGDELTMQIAGRGQRFQVAGIVASSEFVYLMKDAQTLMPDPASFGVVYADMAYLQQLSGHAGQVNSVLAALREPDSAERYTDRLKDEARLPILSAEPRANQLSHSMLRQEIDSLRTMATSLPAVFLLFAAIMLIATLGRTIKGDRTSIGVLKALGYQNREIMRHYTLYAVTAGLSGGLIGNVIGSALSSAMTRLYLVYFHMPAYTIRLYPRLAALSLAASCLLAAAAGVYASRTVLAVTPADAMRPEPPKSGRRIWLEGHWPSLWHRVSFSGKLILRSLAREKKKALLAACGVAMTCGLLIVSFWFHDIFNAMAYRHFDETMRMDYTLSTDGFVDASTVREAAQIPGVAAAEGRLELACELTCGPYSKTAALIGIEPESQFFTLKDQRGHTLSLDGPGLILSSNLARDLHASPGDTLHVKCLLTDREAQIMVSGINEQLLGSGVYMAREATGEALAQRQVVNGFYLASMDDLTAYLREMCTISAYTSKRELQAMYTSFLGMVMASVVFMVLFSGILGCAIIYSTTIMSIHERTAEFSSLRVLGYRKQEIFRLLLGENMLASLAGLVLGLPLGLVLIRLMSAAFTTDLYTLNEPARPGSILLALAVTVLFVLAAQLITYRRIRDLDFIQALKTRIS